MARRHFVNDSADPLVTLQPMSAPLPFSAAGRLPASGDNVAIAIRPLEAGTVVEIDGRPHQLGQTVLEGHRFAVRSIAPGEPLLSWGLPFGHALTPIAPGMGLLDLDSSDFNSSPTHVGALTVDE